MVKKILSILILLFMSNFAYADTFFMSAPSRDDIVWDASELKYNQDTYKGESVVKLLADNFGYYKNGKYIDTSYMPKSFGWWKYYVIAYPGVRCYKAYEDTLISVFEFNKENEEFVEYIPALRKSKQKILAYYKRINDDEFVKLDSNRTFISRFTRLDHPQHYWYEYDKDNNLITKHHTDHLPYQPTKYKHWALGNEN